MITYNQKTIDDAMAPLGQNGETNSNIMTRFNTMTPSIKINRWIAVKGSIISSDDKMTFMLADGLIEAIRIIQSCSVASAPTAFISITNPTFGTANLTYSDAPVSDTSFVMASIGYLIRCAGLDSTSGISSPQVRVTTTYQVGAPIIENFQMVADTNLAVALYLPTVPMAQQTITAASATTVMDAARSVERSKWTIEVYGGPSVPTLYPMAKVQSKVFSFAYLGRTEITVEPILPPSSGGNALAMLFTDQTISKDQTLASVQNYLVDLVTAKMNGKINFGTSPSQAK